MEMQKTISKGKEKNITATIDRRRNRLKNEQLILERGNLIRKKPPWKSKLYSQRV